MQPTVVGTIILIITLPLAVTLLRNVMPYRAPQGDLNDSFQGLTKQYLKWEFLALLIFIGCTVAVTYLLSLFFQFMAHLHVQSLGPSFYRFVLPDTFWAIPAIMLALVISAPLLHVILMLLLKDRYEAYSAYGNTKINTDGYGWRASDLKYTVTIMESIVAIFLGFDYYTRYEKKGFDAWHIVNTMTIVVIVLSSGLVMLGYNNYICLTEKELVINPFFKLEETVIPYDRIMEIHHAQQFVAENGTLVNWPGYLIVAENGVKWRVHLGNKVPPMPEEELVNFIARKSDKEIRLLEVSP
jgi:uncharacterized protein (UPF0248 family)